MRQQVNLGTFSKRGMQLAKTLVLLSAISVTVSCERDYLQRPVPPAPPVAEETETLEASFVTDAPSKVNASYWKTADFLSVDLVNLSTEKLHSEDGHLNMSGTFKGLTDFDNADARDLILKAAYDDEQIYIFLEWTDYSQDAYRSSWFFEGKADPNKSDSTGGWTSQRNDDKMALVFNAGSISDFSTNGCRATCHSGEKKTISGVADLWEWSLLESDAFGYALNEYINTNPGINRQNPIGNLVRNAIDSTSFRSGPKYEFNGVKQEIQRSDLSASVLDPAYYLLNKTNFLGDPVKGKTVYLNDTKGCYQCHGEDGEGRGDFGRAPAFTSPSFNAYSRQTFDELAKDDSHTGKTYYTKVSDGEKDDLIAYIRGFAGVPGYYFDSEMVTDADITTHSNVSSAKISNSNTTYQVVFTRKLNTGKENDVVFDPSVVTYPFGVALMHADDKNHIGTVLETLTFLEK